MTKNNDIYQPSSDSGEESEVQTKEHSDIFFKAWVPNVAGRLSFRVIGDSDQPSRCKYENETVQDKGRVIATQIRQLDDSLLPYVIKIDLVRSVFLSTTQQFFILCGEWEATDSNDSSMEGCIAMIPWPERKRFEAMTQDAMEEWRSAIKNGESTIRIKYDALTAALKATAYVTKFTLIRDGEITLALKKLPEIEYKAPSLDYKKREKELAAELYFFVRDISHTHTHHSATSDRVLDVVRVNDLSNKSWIKQIFTELRQHSIKMRRGRRSKIGDPSGFLAYAESFKLICDRKKESASMGFPQFNEVHFGPIRASIEARQHMDREQQQRMFNTSSAFIQVFFSVAAVALATVSLLQLQQNEFQNAVVSSSFMCIGHKLLEEIHIWLPIVIYAGLMAYYGSLGYLTKPYITLATWFARLFHALPRPVTALIFIFLGLALSYLPFSYVTQTNPIFSPSEWNTCIDKYKRKNEIRKKERTKVEAAQTTLNPQAAWPFPTASKP